MLPTRQGTPVVPTRWLFVESRTATNLKLENADMAVEVGFWRIAHGVTKMGTLEKQQLIDV